jgi:hypothetical protein
MIASDIEVCAKTEEPASFLEFIDNLGLINEEEL